MLKFPFNRSKKEDTEKEKPEEKVVKKRKKKDPPPKPWGALERFIILFFLVLAPLLSIGFFVKSKSIEKQKLPATNLISNIIKTPKDTSILSKNLQNELQNLEGTYGIWVQAADNSYSFGLNEQTQFDGASLFKLPLMIGYFEEVDKGNINPNTNYTLKYSDQAAGAGILSTLSPGTVVTYHDIVEAMGKNSDNSAFQIMTNILGSNKEKDVISEIGMTNTDFDNDRLTPQDLGRLFYTLLSSNIISGNSKKELINSLENTDFENLIPLGVPQGTLVAHKYGAIDSTTNDAGIIYATRPYILVILTKDTPGEEALGEIPKISKIVYDWQAL